jgi:hypothetical protein
LIACYLRQLRLTADNYLRETYRREEAPISEWIVRYETRAISKASSLVVTLHEGMQLFSSCIIVGRQSQRKDELELARQRVLTHIQTQGTALESF